MQRSFRWRECEEASVSLVSLLRKSAAHHRSPLDLQENAGVLRQRRDPRPFYSTLHPLYRPPTFRFQPCVFVPEDLKTRLVLTLCDPESDPSFILADPKPTTVPLDRLADIFFEPGTQADSKRVRLLHDAHFVRYNNRLKCLRIPSLVIDTNARHITLDWRQLCQDFLYDEMRCRVNSASLGQ